MVDSHGSCQDKGFFVMAADATTSRRVTPKKCTRYGDALAIKLLFSLLKLLVFFFGRLRCRRRSLFPFRKRSLPFLTLGATIRNQAFSQDRCNIFPGLS